ncbi:MAG: hypothetical protein SF029_26045 [bacterium]|nr:hypothetical protein [bacterium]
MIIKTSKEVRANPEFSKLCDALNARGLVIEWSDTVELKPRFVEFVDALKSGAAVENPVQENMVRLMEILGMEIPQYQNRIEERNAVMSDGYRAAKAAGAGEKEARAAGEKAWETHKAAIVTPAPVEVVETVVEATVANIVVPVEQRADVYFKRLAESARRDQRDMDEARNPALKLARLLAEAISADEKQQQRFAIGMMLLDVEYGTFPFTPEGKQAFYDIRDALAATAAPLIEMRQWWSKFSEYADVYSQRLPAKAGSLKGSGSQPLNGDASVD